MFLLQVNQILIQSFNLALQLHVNQVGVINNLAQVVDVELHYLPQGIFTIKPAGGAEECKEGSGNFPCAILEAVCKTYLTKIVLDI